MSALKEKVEDYYRIANYMVWYKLACGQEVSFRFEKAAFPHLVGIHKLIDIPLIRRYNDCQEKMVSAKYLLAKIRQGKLSETDLRKKLTHIDNYVLSRILLIKDIMWSHFSMRKAMII